MSFLRGTPSLFHNILTGPRSLPKGYPSHDRMEYHHSTAGHRPGRRYPRRGWGTPPPTLGYAWTLDIMGQDRIGWGTSPCGTGHDGIPPPDRIGYAWTGYGAGGRPLAISLRGTFLLSLKVWRNHPVFHLLIYFAFRKCEWVGL